VVELWICPACGANFAPAEAPPERCALCEDERQYVPPSGQAWTSRERLAAEGASTELRAIEPELWGLGASPSVGVGQRGVVVRVGSECVLFDPPPYVDDAALAAVGELGELRAVGSSHPHMYGAAVQWSHALGAGILLCADDLSWLARPDPAVRGWTGACEVLPGVTLVQCGGHFPGSSVLHWADGADGRGVLVCGDTIFVCPGEDRLTFLYSAPNRLPLSEPAVRGIVAAVSDFAFDRVYGGWWAPVLRSGAHEVLERSAQRYIECLRGTGA
jgi:hypothetical protein